MQTEQIILTLQIYRSFFRRESKTVQRNWQTFRTYPDIRPTVTLKLMEHLRKQREQILACTSWMRKADSPVSRYLVRENGLLLNDLALLDEEKAPRLILKLDQFFKTHDEEKRMQLHVELQPQLKEYHEELTQLVGQFTTLMETVQESQKTLC